MPADGSIVLNYATGEKGLRRDTHYLCADMLATPGMVERRPWDHYDTVVFSYSNSLAIVKSPGAPHVETAFFSRHSEMPDLVYCYSSIIRNDSRNWLFDLSRYTYGTEYFRCVDGGDSSPAVNLLVNALNHRRIDADKCLSLLRANRREEGERLTRLMARAAEAAATLAGLRQIRGVTDLYDLVRDGMPAFVEVMNG